MNKKVSLKWHCSFGSLSSKTARLLHLASTGRDHRKRSQLFEMFPCSHVFGIVPFRFGTAQLLVITAFIAVGRGSCSMAMLDAFTLSLMPPIYAILELH